VPIHELLSDQDKLDVASFRFIVATEAAIDLCLHVTAKLLKQVPAEYAGCFKLLGEAGLIDDNLAAQLSQMARFRNLLVHHYFKIDYSRLRDIICGPELDDLAEFIKQITQLAEGKSDHEAG
jgi:uncharacterized protein YutE (UPF0331/DUF86 family)